MKTLHINVKDKIATYTQRDGAVVCGNTDYQIAFAFDSEWDEYPEKTARFIWNGHHFDQPFTGSICPMPMVFDTTSCTVGVYVEDLETTTPAKIDCLKSVLCGNTKKFDGNDKVYADEAKDAANRAISYARQADESATRAESAANTAEDNVRNALTEAKASGEFDGKDGTSVIVTNVSESTVSGGDNVVNFSDGKRLTVKNGKDGKDGKDGNDYVLTDTDMNEIADDVKASLPSEPWTFTVENDNGSTSTVVKDVYVDDGVGGSQNPSRICNINNGISVIDAGLTYARGVVEVRKTGSILWLIDSGVYNFTADFKQANNRTVLQFDLPKWLSNKMSNVNGVYGGTGTIGYFPALAYENVTYTTFNCQSYLKRSAVGTDADTFQLVYTGLNAVSGGGLCGFHLKMPILLIDAEA